MGLFSNHKKLCPICGGPTPRLLATKVEDTPICKECDRKLDLPDGGLSRMTLDGLRKYMAFYEGNQALRDRFTETYRFSFGFLGGSMLVDTTHRLFRLRDDANALVMEAANLKSFRILEDNAPLFESGAGVLRCHVSSVPQKIRAMAPQIERFAAEKREYERLEEMERMMERRARERNDGAPPPHRPYRPRPSFSAPMPFSQFRVELTLTHPYWGSMSWKLDGPSLDSDYPSAESYLQKYEANVSDLHALASRLMGLIAPGAGEEQVGGAAAQPSVTRSPAASAAPAAQSAAEDPVEQIKKYKALLDSGAITEEEFAAKKRQLLGI